MLWTLLFFLLAAALANEDYIAERQKLQHEYDAVATRYEELQDDGPPDVPLEDPAYIAYEEALIKLRRELHGAKRLLKVREEEMTAEHAAEMRAMRKKLEAQHAEELAATEARHETEIERLEAELAAARAEAAEASTGGRVSTNVENNVNVHVNVNAGVAAAPVAPAAPVDQFSEGRHVGGGNVLVLQPNGRYMNANRVDQMRNLVRTGTSHSSLMGGRLATLEEYAEMWSSMPLALGTADELAQLNPNLTPTGQATNAGSLMLWRMIVSLWKMGWDPNDTSNQPHIIAVGANTIVFEKRLEPLMVAYQATDDMDSRIVVRLVGVTRPGHRTLKLKNGKLFTETSPKSDMFEMQINNLKKRLREEGKTVETALDDINPSFDTLFFQ